MPPLLELKTYLNSPLQLAMVVQSSPQSSSSHSTFDVNVPSASSSKRPLSCTTSSSSISNAATDITTTTTSASTSAAVSVDRRRCRHSVSFNDNASVVPTVHHFDFSINEREQCWFTREEFYEMRLKRKETIRFMEKIDRNVDDDHHYFRGLEFKTREGSRLKQWNVMESCMVVIDEQLRHQQLQLAAAAEDAALALDGDSVSGSSTASRSDRQQQLLSAQSDDIARAYRACTESSQQAAVERAMWDRYAALACNEGQNQTEMVQIEK